MNKNIKTIILKLLADFQEVDLCLIYGSYANGSENNKSDVDIAIAATSSITSKRFLKLKQDLTLQLNKNIDLIDLEHSSGLIYRHLIVRQRLLPATRCLVTVLNYVH